MVNGVLGMIGVLVVLPVEVELQSVTATVLVLRQMLMVKVALVNHIACFLATLRIVPVSS